jgi:hypothetical protein
MSIAVSSYLGSKSGISGNPLATPKPHQAHHQKAMDLFQELFSDVIGSREKPFGRLAENAEAKGLEAGDRCGYAPEKKFRKRSIAGIR